jgi:mono/diheme cytochrome c family protein
MAPDSTGPVTSFVLIADSVAGDRLYRGAGKCITCHGADGLGIEGLGPGLRDTVWADGDGSMAFQQRVIRDGVARPRLGRTVMPSFGTALGATEIFRIAAYVYSLSHPGSTVADTARVDTARVAHPVRAGVLPH